MSEAEDDAIFIGSSVKKEQLLLRLANRHGLSRVSKSGLPGFGENAAKTKGSKQAFVGQPRNVCLVTGATGTGETVSLQILAEGFSNAGVPVFAADIKGDLSGLAAKGVSKPFLEERAQKIGLENYSHDAFPVIFWDLFGVQGHLIRATAVDRGHEKGRE